MINLRDAIVLFGSMFVLLLAVAAFAFAAKLSKYADPCEWVALQLCEHQTGKHIHSMNLSGFKTKGRAHIRSANVLVVMPLEDNDNCVVLIMSDGETATVIGSRDELLQQLNPKECKK